MSVFERIDGRIGNMHAMLRRMGIDPEAFVAGSDQAVTPPLNRIIATFNLRW